MIFLEAIEKLKPYPAVATIIYADLTEINDRLAAKTSSVALEKTSLV